MNLSYFTPEIVIFVGACLLLLLSVIRLPRKNWVLGVVAFGIILVSLTILAKDVQFLTNSTTPPAGSLIIQDDTAAFCRILILLITFPVLLSSMEMFTIESKRQGEFLFLLLLSVGALMFMVQTANLIVLYLSIECASIPLYMLAGLKTGDIRPKEAVVKYFLLGAFASAITIYGMSLVFSVAKSFDFISIAKISIETTGIISAYTIGFLLIIAGLSFKVAAVPFHFWAPDVYEGAPPVSTAFISVAPKIGALVALSRFLGSALPASVVFHDLITYVLMGISVASMTYGNITALVQTEVKRIMAYSSIAQVGYMLIAVATIASSSTVEGLKGSAIYGILMYVAAYAMMNIAVFSIIKVVDREKGGTTLEHFKGLSKTHPVLAICMVVALVSLLGIPFTAGFFGKLLVFSSAIKGSMLWIVVVALLNSALSAFYYFNIAKAMYIESGESDKLSTTYMKSPATISTLVCTAVTLVMGLVPAIYAALETAAKSFGQ